ncbi:MAG: LysM peptidoglycan-binding domain-containing protein [Alistipes sp.]|nr:LysM peptidoglycan-binding domain-containing protein [Alistipes sp.]
MNIRYWLLTLLFVGAVSSMSAQEIVVIDGAKYAIHDVAKGETLYSLARRYGVTVDEIKGANAALAGGLKAGQRIKIPVKAEESAPQSVATPQVRVHKVMKGETLYSLAKMNGLSVEELQAANPHIRKGLKAGQLIDIPQRGAATEPSQGEVTPNLTLAPTQTESVKLVEEPSIEQPTVVPTLDAQPLFRTLKAEDRAEVALLLPLGSEEKPAQNYLDFYRGFLIGLDSVRMAGHSVNLSLYNTKHDYNRVVEIIASGALEKSNLVVGPIYEDELIPVATALQGKNIPVVSPLANLTQSVGGHIFQMSPSQNTKLEKVRSMFDGSKRVVIISTDNIDKEFDAEVRSMLRDTSYVVEHKYIYEHPSIIEKREKEREKMREQGLEVDDTPSPSDMSPLLRGEQPTVVVITANNEIEVDRILAAIASANIALTARSQRVVPFVVFGNNRWNRYRNIDRAILFTNNVTMLSTYHARRSEPKIKAFDKRFVEEFNALPSLYAYRGYDAAVVFVKSLYGAIETGLEGAHLMPLLTPYAFESNPATGVRINNQWIKVNYNSNFTITTE